MNVQTVNFLAVYIGVAIRLILYTNEYDFVAAFLSGLFGGLFLTIMGACIPPELCYLPVVAYILYTAYAMYKYHS